MCVEGEDGYFTRRHDVLTPTRDYASEAPDVSQPFYGIKNSGERKRMIRSGAVRRLVKVLQAFDARHDTENVVCIGARLW